MSKRGRNADTQPGTVGKGGVRMLAMLLSMAGGIALGKLLSAHRSPGPPRCLASQLQRAGTAALLFCIGVWLGGNPDFWAGLRTAGPGGTAIALAGTAGSVGAVYLTVRLCFGEEKK